MAGTVVLDNHQIPEPSVGRLVYTATADAADGSFPSFALPDDFDGRILAITTNPGTPAPTALYDVAVTVDGFDILGGAGDDLSATVTARTAVTDGFVSRREAATLDISGNAVNDAVTVVTLHYTQHV